jgi:hypothetical protein
MRFASFLTAFLFISQVLGADVKPAQEKMLFDFEDAAEVKDFSNLVLRDAKEKEPEVKIERVAEKATAGKHSLKLTFNGGTWPTVTTTRISAEAVADWNAYQTFKADVTVERDCVVGFTIMQEKSKRGGGWDPGISRWCKTEFLHRGVNHIVGSIHHSNEYSIHPKWGALVRFEIFMYQPHKDEVIYVDNVRLSTAREESAGAKTQFRVLGTDVMVSGVRELGLKLKDQWKKPTDRSVADVEGAFRSRYETLKKEHPRAVLAILRDGEKGFDPSNPDKVYDGWKDAYWSSHGPDALTVDRAENRGKHGNNEVFMRHRSPLMRVELSSIPAGSKVLAAELLVVRSNKPSKEHNPFEKPNMWVAEACNRPWHEYEVNAYEYAHDKFWKQIGGMYWGEDPDFLPIYLAYGQSGGTANVWDFTEAVRFWTDGKHANHGFMLHGNGVDYMIAHMREASDIKTRPAVFVIYEPK